MLYHLVTTDNTKLKNKDKIYLLGHWCLDLNKNNLFKNLNYNILKHHWSNKEKFNKDYHIIINITEKLLKNLISTLNTLHKKKISSEQWRIILYPWLVQYVSVLYDRWETCVHFEKKNKSKKFILNNFNYESNIIVSESHEAFYEKTNKPEWNNFIFKRIFNYQNLSIIFKQINVNCIKEKIKNKTNRNLIFNLKLYLNRLISNIAFKINPVLFESYFFPKKYFLSLCLKNRLIPARFIFFFTKSNKHYDLSLRTYAYGILKKKKIQKKTNFEKFVYQFIFDDMPTSYMENFIAYHNKSTNLPIKKAILTMHSSQWNDYFKIYLSEAKKNKSKIIISDHGGGLLPKYDPLDKFHEKVFDHRISFFTKHNKKFYLNLTPTLPVIDEKPRVSNEGKFLLFSITAAAKYQYKICSVPTYNDWLINFKDIIKIAKSLNYKIIPKIKFRIKDTNDSTKVVNDILKNIFCKKNIEDISKNSYHESILKSKLVIHNYGQTSFTECMYLNIPSILLFKKKIMQLDKFSNYMFDILKKNNIAFENPRELSSFINKNWENVDVWWNSKNVQKVRKFYLKHYFDINKKKIPTEWDRFVKKLKF